MNVDFDPQGFDIEVGIHPSGAKVHVVCTPAVALLMRERFDLGKEMDEAVPWGRDDNRMEYYLLVIDKLKIKAITDWIATEPKHYDVHSN